MDFVSPEHLFEELPLTKEEASILDEYICDYDFTVVGKQGGGCLPVFFFKSGYFLSWVLFVRS